jgi:putative membrane protein
MSATEEFVQQDNKKEQEMGTRLNKYSPLFIALFVVIKSIIPMAIGMLTYAKTDMSFWLFGGIAALILLFAVLQYWFYHYWLKDDKIEIKEGILFKKNRKVPYTRIQNVNVSQNPLERFFKVATLQLESASGGKPEAVMRVVDLTVVEEIKRLVKNSNNDAVQVADNIAEDPQQTVEDSDKEKLLELSVKDVVKYGVISQKGMLYGAIVFGFLAQNQGFVAGLLHYLGLFYTIPDFTKVTLAEGFIYVGVVGLALFVFLQLMSILWALLKFYQFDIAKNDDRLQAHMGLLSKISATIPLKKIQLYRISENPLHKFFKAKTITIETAGGVNTDKSGIVMRWLAPYISVEKVKDFIYQIEPKIKLASLDWQLIPYRAWKRVIKRSLITLTVISAIVIGIASLPQIEVKLFAWVAMVLMIPVTYLYAKNYVKKTAYFINDDIICFKSGVWFGKQSFVKISKIQTIEVLESYFDRRNKMATLEIDTAGSNPLLHHVRIPYLEIEDAYKLRKFIQEKLNETEFDW